MAMHQSSRKIEIAELEASLMDDLPWAAGGAGSEYFNHGYIARTRDLCKCHHHPHHHHQQQQQH